MKWCTVGMYVDCMRHNIDVTEPL